MSRLLKCLRKLVEVLEECEAPYAVLGGLAIPAFGVPRSTVDVDIGLAVKGEKKLEEIVQKLEAKNVRASSEVRSWRTVAHLSDKENLVDIEIWLVPDGIRWNQEILKRRWRVTFNVGGEPLEVYTLSPEDFIVNKLARKDRGAGDEEDVISVMAISKNKIDWRYLNKRAREEKVFDLLQALKEKISGIKR